MDWMPMGDPGRVDQIVDIALDGPRHAAGHKAYWIDSRTTHHEGAHTRDNSNLSGIDSRALP
jgi:hypothetical protein